MPSPPPQPVPTRQNPPRHVSGSHLTSGLQRPGASPLSYGGMQGISFSNGGMSFDKPKSFKWSVGNSHAMGGGAPGSYGARFYGDGGDSPYQPFSTSITMGESSFAASSSAFNLPSAMSSSYQRRSYAAALSGNPSHLSTSFASMSFQPMSFGTSYSKNQVHNLMQTRSDAELTKAYECCGQTHEGLHALLEHVEDAHPFSDPDGPSASVPKGLGPNVVTGFSPITHAMELDMEGLDNAILAEPKAISNTSRSSQSPNTLPSYPLPPSASKPTTPTELPPAPSPLRISDVLTSPPENESAMTSAVSSTSSPPDTLATPTTSAQPSPVFAAPKMNPARPGFLGSTAPRTSNQKRFDRAFNEVVAGSPNSHITLGNNTAPKLPTAVAPGMLFGTTAAGLGIPTTPPVQKAGGAGTATEPVKGDSPVVDTTGKLPDPQLPQPSLFSTHRPWRCPNPGCNKAYKQSNGLKYHQQRGQCDFALHDAVDLGLSVEEAEERNRPYICAVGAGCTKRYRQMNGLKYHYLNSGEHGQYGLRMIQNGTHPHPPSMPAPANKPKPAQSNLNPNANANANLNSAFRPGATNNTSTARPGGAPYAIPSKVGQPPTQPPNRPGAAPGPRMGTWPKQPLKAAVPQAIQLPSQRGRDAVLFAAVGNDPLDVNGRLEI